jgi:hypothetical protein
MQISPKGEQATQKPLQGAAEANLSNEQSDGSQQEQ